jgi:predicted CXXCH cytochrome family protein
MAKKRGNPAAPRQSPVAPEPKPGVAAAPPRRAVWALALLVLLAAAAWGLWSLGNRDKVAGAPAAAPPAAASASLASTAYVDNQQCLRCHQAEAAAWLPSHHAKAMAPANAQSVRGDFEGTRFKHKGLTTRFFKRGDKFFVNTEGPDGKAADFEIKYTFGYEPLQQYLIETVDGRLQPLTIAWDTRNRKWFHLFPDEITPPGDVLHWTGRYQTANTMCISCHTTAFDKRYDAKADRFDSRWAEVNVSCQSCHGPGQRHVDWAREQADGKMPPALPNHGLPVATQGVSPQQQVQACAACHARRAELTAVAVPGGAQLDHYLPSLLREGLYHADGQQLDEVFVDGSFRQSKMYQQGVSCLNCHDAHSAKTRLPGNALCLQCHQPKANPAFPQAAGDYDTPAHHHHLPHSPGAQCTACHMPAKNYMRIQARPDHSMRVPRPDLTLAIGTPNACSNCHDDKSALWAVDAITRWVGPKQRPRHYGEVFAAARAHKPEADAALAQTVADKALPAIVRATALDHLGSRGAAGLDARIEATRDADAEVRAAAAAALEALPASMRVPTLAPLLKDPVRAVRIAAARSLATLPPQQFDAPRRAAFDAALAEYIAAQSVALDMPGPNLNLGVLYESLGRDAEAEAHYLRALKIDPDFTPARANLSRFYATRSRPADAEKVLTVGLQRQPGIGELQYSLGLLLAEEQRLSEAEQALGKAAKLMPGNARAQYNHGLALQQLGQRKPAESALLAAQRLDPTEPAFVYALAVLYAQAGQRDKAIAAAQRLQALRPGDAQAAQFLQRLRSAAP